MSELALNPENWSAICLYVNEAMTDHIKPSITPISKVLEHDYGELEGTGYYVEIQNQKHLLTNEHVARALQTHSIAHQFYGTDIVVKCVKPMLVDPYPIDVAIS